MKKLIAVLLAAMLITFAAAPVFAANSGTTVKDEDMGAEPSKDDTSAMSIESLVSGVVPQIKSAKDNAAETGEGFKGGLMALTFDDGPSQYTNKLLDALKERNIHATFFVVGDRISEFEDVIKREYDEGHEVANHTYSHVYLTNLSTSEALNQLEKTDDTINQLLGITTGTPVVRPPGGYINDSVAANLGKPVALWSIDTLDWKSRDADAVEAQILNQACDGGIILLHDLYETSVDGGIAAIDKLSKEGWEFCTFSELYRRKGLTLENGVTYIDAPNDGVDFGVRTEAQKRTDAESAIEAGLVKQEISLGIDPSNKDEKESKTEKTKSVSDNSGDMPKTMLIICCVILLIYLFGFVRILKQPAPPAGKAKINVQNYPDAGRSKSSYDEKTYYSSAAASDRHGNGSDSHDRGHRSNRDAYNRRRNR